MSSLMAERGVLGGENELASRNLSRGLLSMSVIADDLKRRRPDGDLFEEGSFGR